MHSFGAKALNWMPQSMKDKTIRDMVVGLKRNEKLEKEKKNKGKADETTLNGDGDQKVKNSNSSSQENSTSS